MDTDHILSDDYSIFKVEECIFKTRKKIQKVGINIKNTYKEGYLFELSMKGEEDFQHLIVEKNSIEKSLIEINKTIFEIFKYSFKKSFLESLILGENKFRLKGFKKND